MGVKVRRIPERAWPSDGLIARFIQLGAGPATVSVSSTLDVNDWRLR
jgi:hypothetical protein